MHTGSNKSLNLIIRHESGSDNKKVFPLLGHYVVYVRRCLLRWDQQAVMKFW